jgi:hypothetical protein
MSIGDNNDIFSRLKSALPQRWFGSTSDSMPVVDSLLTGLGTGLSFIYSLYAYAKLQCRIGSATDGWLDVISTDFFGSSLLRKTGQTDASYRSGIQANLFRARATRPAMAAVLTQLTGNPPIIFEPSRPLDTGCLGANSGPASFCGVARMGSIAAPFTALITAYRPAVSGGLAGAAYSDAITWSAAAAPLSHGYTGSLSAQQSAATDADIFAAVEATRPIATNIGVCVTNYGVAPFALDSTFLLDSSTLS